MKTLVRTVNVFIQCSNINQQLLLRFRRLIHEILQITIHLTQFIVYWIAFSRLFIYLTNRINIYASGINIIVHYNSASSSNFFVFVGT